MLSLAVVQTPSWRGQYKVWSAPSMDVIDIKASKVSNEEQVKILLNYEQKNCAAITPCLDQTLSHQGDLIAQVCEQSAAQLEQITPPVQLPDSVVKNLQVYQQSSINTTLQLAERWEIDTNGYDSLPQRVRRLYNLDKLADSKIVNCKEIASLYKSRFPASN